MMRTIAVAVFLLVCSVCAGAAAPPPLPPEPGWTLLPEFDPANPAAWRPMGESDAVSTVDAGGRAALRMPCDFASRNLARASWDLPVKLDLTHARGLQFRFYCPDRTPVSYFSMYLKSQDGWYVSEFSQRSDDGWTTVVFDKVASGIEMEPAGWGRVDLVRISAWRALETDTAFYVADLGYYGSDASIALVRSESGQEIRQEFRTIRQQAQVVSNHLEALGLDHVLLSDLDLTADHLAGKELVILPHNPRMSARATEALARFLDGGGRLLSFYQFPAELAQRAGIRPGSHVPSPGPGAFARIAAAEQPLRGQPEAVQQQSWNIIDVKPVEGRSRVVAVWRDEQDRPSGHAAVVASDNCVHMSHILLADDPTNKRRLLLSMLGHLVPDLWRRSAASALDRAGALAGYGAFPEARAGILREAGGEGDAARYLTEAEAALAEGARYLAEGAHLDALTQAERAHALTLRAHCAAQRPLPGEHRAFWCHSAFGVAGMEWDDAIRILAENGFTAILPNMLWAGSAFYRSDVLPVVSQVAERGDQIALCLAACRKYGVECHVWKVNYNMGGSAPAAFAQRMQSEGRTQVGFDGTPQPRWLCPSHPANQQLEIDSMVEVAVKYDVDGVHFDYIRYPDNSHCFCKGCRERFEAAAGKRVTHWPQDIRADAQLQAAWNAFRRDNITRVVAGVSEAVRRQRPNVKISAAVFNNWPRHRDEIGQDWGAWCAAGYLDFVCPMDYTAHNDQFRNLVAQQVEWSGTVPCYPGIGLSVWPDPTDAVMLIEQIKITREHNTGGFTVFNYGSAQALEVVPLCGLGITRPLRE